MITVKDLNDIAENKIKNEVQKEIIRSGFPPHIADRMCAAIDGKECKKTGTVAPVHRHPTKDESFVLLRGKVKVSTYNDDGSVLESVVLCQEDGRYGVDIPKNVWHNLEAIEAESVIFEVKDGKYQPLGEEDVME